MGRRALSELSYSMQQVWTKTDFPIVPMVLPTVRRVRQKEAWFLHTYRLALSPGLNLVLGGSFTYHLLCRIGGAPSTTDAR